MLRALRTPSLRSCSSRALLRAQITKTATLSSPSNRGYATTDPDVFLQSTNANYIDEMYAAWKEDPSSVHISWQSYFKNLDGGAPAAAAFSAPPTIVPTTVGSAPVTGLTTGSNNGVMLHLKVQLLVRAYQVRGHQRALTDPLEISFGYSDKPPPKELTLEHYGFTEKDLDTTITLGPGLLPNFAGEGPKTLREVVEILKKTYCSSYGVEYMHISSREKCDWIRERVEIPQPFKYSTDERRRILDRLIWSTSFEQFLNSKFPNDKRFGLEGAETLVPGMKTLIDASVERGIEDIVIGMPHRGRLNVLSNVVRKPNESIFSEFGGSATFDEGSGDVKYHLGANYQRPTPSGKKVNLSLVANPSHLEADDPVVLGQVRSIQHFKDDLKHEKAMSILLHGDAAFAAQGVVYETIGMQSLPAYTTGGTVHVIVNNQIGFTTDPRFARSTPYPSDISKSVEAPVFHVNADDMEAVNFIFSLAADWRATFKSDVIIDVVCYRKYGHNETDQPSFTQPLMYKKIAKKENVLTYYEKTLLDEGAFTKEDIEEHKKWVWETLEESFKGSKDYKPTSREWLASAWEGFKTPKELAVEILPHLPTALPEETIKHVGTVVSTYPEGFNVHRNLKRILKSRLTSVEKGEGIDWATGEAIAYGTLVDEGYHVRISGQDVERGTFSQRHAVLHDQENEETYTPLQHVSDKQAKFVIHNSSLSEYGVMGFEYGYSLHNPDALVIWEAQFGDFANTAQVIIDQFIAAGESKWAQRSGLILSLPHGYDGQGPEHSSARIERYLMLANEDSRIFPSEDKLNRQHQDCNVQIAYPSTPANLFHLLRRQMHRQFRKPLALFFSKSLLRHPLARSTIDEFTGDSHFNWIIEDVEHGKSIVSKEETKRLILCSGQVYATLFKARADNQINDTALVKVEQFHPFPFAQVRDLLQSYPNLEDLVWCQEEPMNAGAWTYMSPRLSTTLSETNYANSEFRYAGRPPSASVAAGTKKAHNAEEQAFVAEALRL